MTNQNTTNIRKINQNTITKNQINLGSNRYKNPNKIESAEKSNIPNGISQDILYGNKVENFQRQQILRRLLKEFGLGQYLRVILLSL